MPTYQLHPTFSMPRPKRFLWCLPRRWSSNGTTPVTSIPHSSQVKYILSLWLFTGYFNSKPFTDMNFDWHGLSIYRSVNPLKRVRTSLVSVRWLISPWPLHALSDASRLDNIIQFLHVVLWWPILCVTSHLNIIIPGFLHVAPWWPILSVASNVDITIPGLQYDIYFT